MFVCTECHSKDCHWDFAEARSYGRCETCGKTTGCTDCHNY